MKQYAESSEGEQYAAYLWGFRMLFQDVILQVRLR